MALRLRKVSAKRMSETRAKESVLRKWVVVESEDGHLEYLDFRSSASLSLNLAIAQCIRADWI